MKPLHVIDAGLVGYGTALEWQNDLYDRRLQDAIPDSLLLLEHPHVYTLGRRFSAEHLLLSEDALRRRGIELYEADRGGSITYHGPGQLVGYPVLALENPDVIAYLRMLEGVLIEALAALGVTAGRREGLTGVWVGEEKLASIGVNVTRGVTKHGFALNVTTDLSYFGGMVPCGIPAVRVTSMQVVRGSAPPMAEVRAVVAGCLANRLGARVRRVPAAELGLPGVTMPRDARILPFPHRPGAPDGRVESADG